MTERVLIVNEAGHQEWVDKSLLTNIDPTSGATAPVLADGLISTGRMTAWVPTTIAGNVLWLKADSLFLDDGDTINFLADQSGLVNDAKQDTIAKQPTFKTAIVNSLPVIRFAGTDDHLIIKRNAGLEPNAVTVFLVYRRDINPGTFLYFYAKAQSTTFPSWGMNTNGTEDFRVLAKVVTSGEKVGGDPVLEAVAFDGAAHIVTLREDGANLDLFFDGTAETTTVATGNLVYSASYDLWIGDFPGQPGLGAAFDLCEFLVYNTALDTTNRQRVETYLQDKWATP